MSIMDFCRMINPFNMNEYFILLDKELQDVKTTVNKIDSMLDYRVNSLEKKLEFNELLLTAISNTVPDMIWLKGIDGRYIYANDAIKEGLLFDRNPIGKTDVELSKAAKAKFGADKHTFGDVCHSSDDVIIETKENRRFLEHGLILGTDLFLEVYKAPFYDMDGELIGVCGVGRDLTAYVKAYRGSYCSSCTMAAGNDIFSQFEYKVDL